MKLVKWEDFEVRSQLIQIALKVLLFMLSFVVYQVRVFVNTGEGDWSLAFLLHTVISMEAHSFRFVKSLLLHIESVSYFYGTFY